MFIIVIKLMKASIKFNFKELKKKYNAEEDSKQKAEQTGEKILLYQEAPVNPLVAKQCEKIAKDYVTYYNNNRYFYLHTEPKNIDIIEKIKNDEFHQIRKQYETTLVKEKQIQQKIQVLREPSPKKKTSKAEKVLVFRHLSYLFRKNIKIIIAKLKTMKINVNDIFTKKLFSNEAYLFGKQIFQAVKFGQDTKVWRYYIQNKFVVFSVDSSGKTPLIWSCVRGHNVVTDMLISMGALVNKKDILGHTALFYAINYKHVQCVKILVLNEAIISQEIVKLSLSDKKIKNIIELSLSIMSIIKRMPYDKRSKVFEQKLRQLK